jgi:glycosyltransferase involved in cell wall biosynthesis
VKLLAFGTFPIRLPVHGGQRRVAALKAAHERAGHRVAYLSAFNEGAYQSSCVTRFDLPVADADVAGDRWASDLSRGEACAADDDKFAYFSDFARYAEPDAFILERPFMWPVVKRLIREGSSAKLVYASHGIEGQLKRQELAVAGIAPALVDEVVRRTESLECSVLEAADAVLAVSDADASWYRGHGFEGALRVVPNGTPAARTGDADVAQDILEGPFLLFVGSAHRLNAEGFVELILGEGLQFMPPVKCFAVAGNVSELIFTHPAFQRRLASNCDRAHFFPNPTDAELQGLIDRAHGIVLPIVTASGTALKTAEALWSGKWVVASPAAMRGFEAFERAPGVMMACGRDDFTAAIRAVMERPALRLSQDDRSLRQAITWEAITAGFDVAELL